MLRWRFLLMAKGMALGIILIVPGGPGLRAAQDGPSLAEPRSIGPPVVPSSQALLGASGEEAPPASPPEVEAILDRRAARQQACEHADWPRWCRYCAQARAGLELAPKTLRPFSTELGLFALGQPYQYMPPQYPWTLLMPPFPKGRKAGAPPAPVSPWGMPHYLDNFRHLDDPENRLVDPFDVVKRMPAADGAIVSDFGGEFRWQGRVEDNRRLIGEQNNHSLFRERIYLDTWYWNRFRTFVEVLWADSTPQSVQPVFLDLNHGDLLNAFGEFRFYDQDQRTFSARFGDRQQLLFGNQRLVSPLDWANSPRTFKNVANGLWRSPNWDLDLFWSRPNVILANQFDESNNAQQFFGTYLTYKGRENRLYDFYYLGFLQENQLGVVFNGERGNLAIHTLGTRWQGQWEEWLWEGEAAYQFGFHQGLPRNAGAVSAGFGRKFPRLPFNPMVMAYFDYASGNRRPGAGNFATFNQLFPFGHKYLGLMDIVGRQNLIAPHAYLRLNFGARANLVFWYNNFHLASARAPLFNAAGAPIRFDPTGSAGRFVGNELDIVLTTYLNPHTDFQFGVSKFFSGTFIQRTAPDPAAGADGFFFYTQFTFRF